MLIQPELVLGDCAVRLCPLIELLEENLTSSSYGYAKLGLHPGKECAFEQRHTETKPASQNKEI